MKRRKLATIMILGLITVSVISGCKGDKKEVAKKPTKNIEVSKDKKTKISKKDETNKTDISKKEKSDSKKTDDVETKDSSDTSYVANDNTDYSSNSGGQSIKVDYIPQQQTENQPTQQPEKTPNPQSEPEPVPESVPEPDPAPQPVPESEPEKVWVEEVGHMEPGELIEEAWDEKVYAIRTICFNCGADITGNAENHACPDGSIHHGYGSERVLMDVIHHPAIYGDPYWVVDIPGHYE